MWRNFFHFSFSTKICWESSYEYCIILILWWRNKWFIHFSVSVQLTKWFRFYIKQCLSHDIQHDNNENVLSYLQRKLFIFPSHQWHISEYEHVVMLSSFFFCFFGYVICHCHVYDFILRDKYIPNWHVQTF